jgi:hypothetical protein
MKNNNDYVSPSNDTLKYTLDLNILKPGDIILSSGNGKASETIKKATDSNYSHAMLYIDRQINHATPEGGVFSVNPQRLIYDSISDIKVLRLTDYEKRDKEQLLRICDYSGTLICSIYSVKEALTTSILRKTQVKAKSSDQFCSRFVAQSYASEDINLVDNIDYCSPGDLERSIHLTVVDNAVREANEDDLLFAKTPDPTQRNLEVTYAWLYKARDLAEKENFKIQTIGCVSKFLEKHPKYDSDICEYIKESGYLTQYMDDLKINSYRYNKGEYQEFVDQKRNEYSPSEIVAIQMKKEPGMIRRFSININAALNDFNRTKLHFHFLQLNLYRNILTLIINRLEVMYSHAGLKERTEIEEHLKTLNPIKQVNEFLDNVSK